MKKLLAKIMEEGFGTCNFCQTENVEGINGEITIVKEVVDTEVGMVIDDYELKLGLLNSYKVIKGNWHYKEVVKNTKYETKIIKPLICKDCIKQLANQLK